MNFKAELLQFKNYLYNLFKSLHSFSPQPHSAHIHDALSRRIIDEISEINFLYSSLNLSNKTPQNTQNFIQKFQNSLIFPVEKPEILDLSNFDFEDIHDFIRDASFTQLCSLYNLYNTFQLTLNPLDFTPFQSFQDCENLREILLKIFSNFTLFTTTPQLQNTTFLTNFALDPTSKNFHFLTSKMCKKQAKIARFVDKNTGKVLKKHEFVGGQFWKCQECKFCKSRIYGVKAIEGHWQDAKHVKVLQGLGLDFEVMRGQFGVEVE